jgi:hypothetical protein
MRFLNTVVLWLVCMASLQAQISVVPTVKHLTSTSTPNTGTITLNVSGGTSPYSYTWTPGSVYTKDITNKANNAYVVTVKDNAATTLTYTYNIGYKAEWDQMYGCISRNDSLISDASVGWAQAITKNNLAASTDGWVEYILKGTSETKVFGVLDSLSPLPNTYADIDYGYYYEGPTNILYEVYSGGLYNVITGLAEGTALRIERDGSTIKFVVNGVTTHTVSDASATAKVWKAKAMIWGSIVGASLVNVGCSFVTKGNVTFKNYSNIIPFTTHSAGSGLNDGSIRVSPLKTGSYTYTWQPGSVTSATISSKAAGSYVLSAKDAINTIIPKNYNIGYKVNWDQMYSCQQKHDTLITTGAATWGSGISKNTLTGGTDGWFEYVLRDMDQYKAVGFTDSLSPDVNNIYDIDYGFYYELGSLYAFGGGLWILTYNANEGTILRVERRGDTVEYKLNGVIVSSGVYANEGAKDWKVKGIVHVGMNSSLVNVGCSFYGEGNSNFPNYTRLVPKIVHASGPSSNDGSVSVSPVQSGTYTYIWQPGSTTGSSIISKTPGAYALTVKDALNHQNTKSYNVGYKVKWDQLQACVLKHDTLVNDLSYTWGRAISKNTLPGGQDGWMEYVLKDLNQTRVFGFTDSLSPLMEDFNDIDHGFNYDGSNHRLYTHTNHLNTSPVDYNAIEGSILRIERKGDTIYYKVNNVTVAYEINPAAVQRTWKIKADVYAGNTSSMINVGCSFYQEGPAFFPNYNMLIPTIVHSSGVTPGTGLSIPDGSLKVRPMYSGTNPYTYTWQPGGESDTMVVSKKAGNYSVMVEDGLGHKNKSFYHLGYKAIWDSVYGAVIKPDTLETTGMYPWGRAITKNTLAAHADGWFEYVLQDLDKIKIVGFLDSMSTNPQDIYDVDYGYYYDASYKRLYTMYNGSFGYVGQGVAGSVLRVERKGDSILYTLNGVSLGSIVDPIAAAKSWKVKGMVNSPAGTKLVNVGCSFDALNSVAIAADVAEYTIDEDKGSVRLHISGGKQPYNVSWNGIKFPSANDAYAIIAAAGYTVAGDTAIIKQEYNKLIQRTVFSGLEPGKYPITIYDRANDSVNVMSVIGSETDTLLTKGIAITRTPSYQRVSGNRTYFYGETINMAQSGPFVSGKSYAVLMNRIKRDEKNYIEFAISDTTKTIYVGLRDTSLEVPGGFDEIRNKACFEFTGSTYSVWVNNIKKHTGKYNPGDIFAISTSPLNNFMLFYKNDADVYKYDLSGVSGGSEFRVKAVFGSAGGLVKNIKIIGTAIRLRDNVFGTISDVSCGNPCGGSIDATGVPVLISSPVSYELYYGANPAPVATINSFPTGDHAVFTGLCAGLYTVKYCFTAGKSYDHNDPYPMRRAACITQTFEIANIPDWTSTTNVSVSSDGTLTKNAGNILDWDAGASSLNFLQSSDNGWIEWTAPIANSINDIGFSSADVNTDIATIGHGLGYTRLNFGIWGLWQLYIKTASSTMFTSFSSGLFLGNYTGSGVCKFRLEKNGSNINFLVNGQLVDQFTGLSLPGLIVDASLKMMDGTINHPRVSFGCKGFEQYTMLKKKLDGGYYIAYNKKLLFKYDEEYADKDGLLTFSVYDKSNNVVMSNASLSSLALVRYGDNRYSIDLSNTANVISGQSMPTNSFYILEVVNEKNEKWYLRFKK